MQGVSPVGCLLLTAPPFLRGDTMGCFTTILAFAAAQGFCYIHVCQRVVVATYAGAVTRGGRKTAYT